MVLELDEGIKNLSRAITEAIGKDISEVPGTGAAGAMGAGMISFLWLPSADGYPDGSGHCKV